MWTDDQLLAINTTDKAVIVSAAAGSGKTAVLIERTLRILCDEEKKIPADRLLAVTFTNDAAAQMREKLSLAIFTKIEEEPDNEWLQLQQVRLQTARISTINSFCFELVKNNIHNFDISSGVRILDETEYSVMKAKALEDVFEKFYLEKPEMMKFLNGIFCNDTDKQLSEIVEALFDFSRSLPFKDSWFKKAIDAFDKESDMISFWKSLILKDLMQKIKSVSNAVTRASRYSSTLQFHKKAQDIIQKDIEIVNHLFEISVNNDWDSIITTLTNISWASFSKTADKGSNADNAAAETAILEFIHRLRKGYTDEMKKIQSLISYSEAQIESDMQMSKEVLSDLILLVDELWGVLWAKKVEKNAIDFADVEILSIKLLAKETENGFEKTQLANELVSSRQYSIILIDEFQDVNNLQDIIFKVLSDSSDNNIIGRNMFVVGDVKQSIYRFRQANPKIFIQTSKDANTEKNSEIITEIKLRKNFRSRKCVIDFVNFIFHKVMSDEVGEVEYTDDESLELGAQYDNRELSTELMVIDTIADEEAEDGDIMSSDEPVFVAQRIKKMLDEKYPVLENGELRPCKQGDFCVLLRSKTVSKSFVNAFHSYGLSVSNEELTGYLKSREISVLINMLNIIDNPMNDTAMASVLLSPIFMFSTDELALLKINFPTRRLYSSIKKMSDFLLSENELSEEQICIANKCSVAIKKIAELRVDSINLTLERLISRIYDSTDFFAVASAFSDGKQKRANLRLLLEYADSYDKSINGGLSGFIRYINTVFRNGNDFKQAGELCAGDDSVAIKTIHKSKGLEYPFVFLCRTATAFTRQKQDLSKRMLINLNGGVGFHLKDVQKHYKYKTLSYDAVSRMNRYEMLSEEMRLLYVALTRAKEKLFITYLRTPKTDTRLKKIAEDLSSFGGIESSLVASADSMQEWLAMALLTYSKNNFLREIVGNDIILPVYETDAVIDFDVQGKKEAFENESLSDYEDANLPLINEEIYNEVKRYVSFEYDFSLSQKTAKLSVSEVAKDENYLDYRYAIPVLNKEKNKLSAAEKGTATHLFMELCDFEKAEESVEIEIQRLVLSGIMSKKQADSINTSSVNAFFQGEFYKRMKKSSNILREKQFIVRISDMKLSGEILSGYEKTDGMLQGIADCVFEEDDGYTLVDYKTDYAVSTQELKEKYSLQLQLYKAAFDLVLDRPVKSSYIYSFRLETGIEINF